MLEEMSDLNLPPKVLQVLEKVGLTTTIASVLQSSVPELVRITKLSEVEVELLKKAVSQRVTGHHKITSAHDLFIRSGKLSLGCEILDRHLKGGIRSGAITEIYGESASGKTQICLQLCLTVQLPYNLGGRESAAVYICTEDKFPDRRLEQMTPHFKQKYKQVLGDVNIGDHIYIQHVADVKELIDILDNELPALIKAANVGLVVIDSIAGVLRVEYSLDEMNERAQVLNGIGSRLVHLSGENSIPIVCVNQVSAVFDPRAKERKCRVHDHVKPCLGPTWSDWLTVRIMLLRSTGSCLLEKEWSKNKAHDPERELIVIFSRSDDFPAGKETIMKACNYRVDAYGVHGIRVDNPEPNCCRCSADD